MSFAQAHPTALAVKEPAPRQCGQAITEFNAKSSRPYSIPFLSYLCYRYTLTLISINSKTGGGGYCGIKHNNELFNGLKTNVVKKIISYFVKF
jgi:hypothetical protein